MTVESMHASCLRCLGLRTRELRGPTLGCKPPITSMAEDPMP
jgi:hypothetical protein